MRRLALGGDDGRRPQAHCSVLGTFRHVSARGRWHGAIFFGLKRAHHGTSGSSALSDGPHAGPLRHALALKARRKGGMLQSALCRRLGVSSTRSPDAASLEELRLVACRTCRPTAALVELTTVDGVFFAHRVTRSDGRSSRSTAHSAGEQVPLVACSEEWGRGDVAPRRDAQRLRRRVIRTAQKLQTRGIRISSTRSEPDVTKRS